MVVCAGDSLPQLPDLGQTDGMLPHSLGKRGLCWSLPSCDAPVQPVCLGNKFKILHGDEEQTQLTGRPYHNVHGCASVHHKSVFSCCVAQTDKMTR